MRKLFFSFILIFSILSLPMTGIANDAPTKVNVTDEQLLDMAERYNWYDRQLQSTDEALSTQELAEHLFKNMKQKNETFTIEMPRAIDQPNETPEEVEGKINEAVYYAIKLASQKDEELSYDVKKYGFGYVYWSNRVKFDFSLEYGQTLEQDQFVKKRVKEIAASLIKPSMNDHEKVKAVHDYVILNTAYDQSLNQEINNPYHLLTQGTSLCGGYSRTTALLLKEAGIPVRVISGTSRGVGHAWNLVQVDGHWFHLDVTWDDPIPDEPGRIYYDYFLLPDKPLRKTHFWTDGGLNKKDAPYPKATTVYEQLLEEKGMRSFARDLGIHSVMADTEEEMIELFKETIRKYDPELSILVDKNMTKDEARAIVNAVNQDHHGDVRLSFIFPNDDSNYTDSRYPDKKRFTLFIKHNYVPTVTSLKPFTPWPTEVHMNEPLQLSAQATWDNGMSYDVTNDVDLRILAKNNNVTRSGSTLYFQGGGPIDIIMSYKGQQYKHSLLVRGNDVIEEPEQPIEPEGPGTEPVDPTPPTETPEQPDESDDLELPEPVPALQKKLKTYQAFSDTTEIAEPTKVWTIAFNANVQQTEQSKVEVFNHKGEAIDASVSLSTEQASRQLTIAPKQPYEVGERIYVLLSNWSDDKGNPLAQPIYFDFFVAKSS